MPKDITHWIIAEQTAASLAGTTLGEAARTCPNALKMGAVFPDMPLYLTGKSDAGRTAEQAGHEYHGTQGSDTYELLRAVLSAALQTNDPAIHALLTGIACHLQTDIIFHPLVFHATGNYHHPDPERRSLAVRGHRRFEVLLDLHFCELLNLRPRSYRADAFWKNLESPDPLFWTRQDSANPQRYPMLVQAIKKYLRVQRLFTNPAASRLAGAFHPWLPDAWQEVTGLFYWSASASCLARFHEKWTYLHPVTGTSHAESLHDLLERAVEASVSLCSRLEAAIDEKDETLFTDRGPSLDYGLVDGDGSTARFFAEPSFFENPPCDKEA